MQTMGNKAWKTHCSQKELECKQWVMKEDSHKELQCKKWVMRLGKYDIFETFLHAKERV
ncbi:hypothetical protein KSS87_001538, partial [Heliosperma pusillum]